MSNLAVWADGPLSGSALLNTAGTFADQSPTEVVLLATAGSGGGILREISYLPLETTTAARINIFSKKSGSLDYNLIDVIQVGVETVSATAKPAGGASEKITHAKPRLLEEDEEIYAQISVSLDVIVDCNGGNIVAQV